MERAELEKKVIAIIEQLRTYLQADGGDIEFVELTDDNIVMVKLQGACGSCPHARMTLKQGVESVMKEQLPEIKAVMDVNLGF